MLTRKRYCSQRNASNNTVYDIVASRRTRQAAQRLVVDPVNVRVLAKQLRGLDAVALAERPPAGSHQLPDGVGAVAHAHRVEDVHKGLLLLAEHLRDGCTAVVRLVSVWV